MSKTARQTSTKNIEKSMRFQFCERPGAALLLILERLPGKVLRKDDISKKTVMLLVRRRLLFFAFYFCRRTLDFFASLLPFPKASSFFPRHLHTNSGLKLRVFDYNHHA